MDASLKFLADVNIEKPIVDELKKMGYDVKWIAEINPHLDDVDIFGIAKKEKRILVTNDKDFGEIVFRQKLLASGVVLFRIKGQNAKEKWNLFKKLLTAYKDKIARHFVVISKDKFRFIPL